MNMMIIFHMEAVIGMDTPTKDTHVVIPEIMNVSNCIAKEIKVANQLTSKQLSGFSKWSKCNYKGP